MAEASLDDNIPPKLRDRLKFGPPSRQKTDNLEALTGIVSVKPGFPVESEAPQYTTYIGRSYISALHLSSKKAPRLRLRALSTTETTGTRTPDERVKDQQTNPDASPNPQVLNVPYRMITPWHIYNEKASKEDEVMQSNINGSMDVVLIFAGLFSATSTAFLQFTLPLLRQDPNDDTNHLLLSIFHKMENASYPLPSPSPFEVSAIAISINCLIFASVAGSLIAAFFALSIKQWTRSYSSGLENIVTPQLLARHRQFRIEGFRSWRLVDISRTLPVILHISLALFAIGVAEFLLYTSGIKVATVIIAAGGGTTLVHILLSLISLFSPQAPFQSPLTNAFYALWSTIQSRYRKMVRRSFHKKGATDPLDRTLGKETSISRLIHVSKHLDIGVLIDLMEIADRHTEEWILDLCLLEITRLYYVPREKYHLFYHDSILETYFYLASTCVYESSGVYHIIPGMEHRARTLCRFLTWFSSIYSKEIYDYYLWKSCQIGSSTDTRGLTNAFYEYARKNGSLWDIVYGYLAWVASMHLCDLPKSAKCHFCVDSNEERSDAVLKFLLNYETGHKDPIKAFQDGQVVIEYIAFQTRCAFHYNNPEYPSSSAARMLRQLMRKYNLYDPMFLEIWEFWDLPEPSADNNLVKDAWIEVLQGAYKRPKHPKRDISPIRVIQPYPRTTHQYEGSLAGSITGRPSSFFRSPHAPIIVVPDNIGGHYRSRSRSVSYNDRNSPPVQIMTHGSIFHPRTHAASVMESSQSRSHSPTIIQNRIIVHSRPGRSRSPPPIVVPRPRASRSPLVIRERRSSNSPRRIVIRRSRSSSYSPIRIIRKNSRRSSSPSPIIIPKSTRMAHERRRSGSFSPIAVHIHHRSRSRSRSRSPSRVGRPRRSFSASPIILEEDRRSRSLSPIIVVDDSHQSRRGHAIRLGRSRSRSPQYRRGHSRIHYDVENYTTGQRRAYVGRDRSESTYYRRLSRLRFSRHGPPSSTQRRPVLITSRRSRSPAFTLPFSRRRGRSLGSLRSMGPNTSRSRSRTPRRLPLVAGTAVTAHPIRATVYCDMYIAATQDKTTIVQMQLDNSMVLTGSSKEGQKVDRIVEFSIDTGPSGVIEAQSNESMEPCLSYAMSHSLHHEQQNFLALNPNNSFLLEHNALWGHLSAQLRQLGVGPQIIDTFIDCHSENLQMHDFIAYRFISREESARMVKLTVGLADCVFNSLCILIQGFSEAEVESLHWRRGESVSIDWSSIVGFEEKFRDSHCNRVLELALAYLSTSQVPSRQNTVQGLDANPTPEPYDGNGDPGDNTPSLPDKPHAISTNDDAFGKGSALQLDLGDGAVPPSPTPVAVTPSERE